MARRQSRGGTEDDKKNTLGLPARMRTSTDGTLARARTQSRDALVLPRTGASGQKDLEILRQSRHCHTGDGAHSDVLAMQPGKMVLASLTKHRLRKN